MKESIGTIFFYSIITSCLFCACKDKMPSCPNITFDNDSSAVYIVQTDTLAKDTAFISIDGYKVDSLIVKDSISLSIKNQIKKIDQLKLAYDLATNNNKVGINVCTKRGIDTTFIYTYKRVKVKPILTAMVVSGNCIGLCNTNANRDYHKKIREWIFDKKISPDSSLIERMNNLMKQLNSSTYQEYSPINSNIPVIRGFNNQFFQFNTSLEGDYFYLYACKYGKQIKSFIKEKITNDFSGATSSPLSPMKCSNHGSTGPNWLLLIAINKDWTYKILPVGCVIIDNKAPEIYCEKNLQFYPSTITLLRQSLNNFSNSCTWSPYIILKDFNIKLNLPASFKMNITSYISVKCGDFQGNEYYGYDVPFYIYKFMDKNDDLESITIGSKLIHANTIVNNKLIRVHLSSLKLGDNEVPVRAVDKRGNVSTSSISIPMVQVSHKEK